MIDTSTKKSINITGNSITNATEVEVTFVILLVTII